MHEWDVLRIAFCFSCGYGAFRNFGPVMDTGQLNLFSSLDYNRDITARATICFPNMLDLTSEPAWKLREKKRIALSCSFVSRGSANAVDTSLDQQNKWSMVRTLFGATSFDSVPKVSEIRTAISLHMHAAVFEARGDRVKTK